MSSTQTKHEKRVLVLTSLILSNSSMQTTPLSASTIAPASRRRSLVSGSTVTAAVRPTPVDPRPVVEMASGAMSITDRSSCDFAVEGSPTIMTLMSPRRCVPFSRLRSQPPSSWRMSAFLMNSCPNIDGHNALDMISSASFRCEISLQTRQYKTEGRQDMGDKE